MASRADIVSGYVQSGGARIYYESAGSGPNLVFIHAGVSDSRMWDPQFAAFPEKFRVVRYDHRGFGKSTQPEESFKLRGDLRSVLEHLGIVRAVLVGCSMGGSTALDYALEHPEQVAGLVLVGSGASGLFDQGQLAPDVMKYFAEYLEAIQKDDREKAREMEAKYWLDGLTREPEKIDPGYRERARQLHRENFSVTRLSQQEETLRPPAIGRFGEVAAPTLVVIGDSDAPDLIKLAHRMGAEIPGAGLVTIENAAHLPSLEHPEEFNRLLAEFLNSVI